jgi:hypothetical protein
VGRRFPSLVFEVVTSAQKLDGESCVLQAVPTLPLVPHLSKVYHHVQKQQMEQSRPPQAMRTDLRAKQEAGT